MVNDNSGIILDEWLTRVIGKDTYRTYDVQKVLKTGVEGLRTRAGRGFFIYCKIPADDIASIMEIESFGFKLVETNVKLAKNIQNNIHSDSIDIKFSEDKDRSGVIRVAGECFKYSRFHIDDNFGDDIANKIKSEWVDGFFKGSRGDFMVVAVSGEEVAGFIQLLKSPEGLIIDLIGVDEKYRGQGFATKMVRFAENNCGIKGNISVGTQLINTPSIRFYYKNGFEINNAFYTFHLHG